jgi:uncharacterized protein YdeI (YjbR/CyaY-like superfamily)
MGKAPQRTPAPVVKRFAATLERMRSRLNWTIIRIPFDAAKVYGMRGQINVKGDINDFEFRTCLFPVKGGGHILLVNKRMQKAARVKVGSVAQFRIESDQKVRVSVIPEPLKRILAKDAPLRRWYKTLTQSNRNDIAKWISDPVSNEAQVRRAEQMAERLLSVMDAERELPPVLQVAFARNPTAYDGWNHMTLARRRGHLFGIFYYRTPEGRGRRIDKMLDDAVAIAEKHADSGS